MLKNKDKILRYLPKLSDGIEYFFNKYPKSKYMTKNKTH